MARAPRRPIPAPAVVPTPVRVAAFPGIASVVVAMVMAAALGACGSSPPPAPVPVPSTSISSTSPTTPTGPTTPTAPAPASLVVEQGGLRGILLNRDTLDVSVADLEQAYGGSGTFVLKGLTDSCNLAIREDLGIAAMNDSNQALLGVVVQTPGARTKEGVGIGDSIEDVVRTYGEEVTAVDTRTSATGGPLVVVNDLTAADQEPGPRSLLYAFDTDPSRTITRIRAGFFPYVAHVAYCSEVASRPENVGWPLS